MFIEAFTSQGNFLAEAHSLVWKTLWRESLKLYHDVFLYLIYEGPNCCAFLLCAW